ncbi:hypothetical protein A9Q84_09400 [Halobacteriovorax marinus]|uniref:Lipid/polyisoprenoid-binding YceI-like domain-containing protein n=1 Tax=Halobacteriovorax marinus TaxID=97084 RepID=A0A1Y5F6X9_9BACT|nr:hypothetical protein A9Q84_09400 [Halobacteriovorax marinus]
MFSRLILISLISTSIFAGSKNVGDFATYSMSVMGMTANQRVEIVNVNRSSAEYSLKTTTTISGQTDTNIENVPTDDIMTIENANMILANCEFMGGINETIQVMGQAKRTCKLEANSDSVFPLITKSGFHVNKNSRGFVWIGAFPVHGIAKLEMEEVTMTIQSMNW